jgi:hypothetical protein
MRKRNLLCTSQVQNGGRSDHRLRSCEYRRPNARRPASGSCADSEGRLRAKAQGVALVEAHLTPQRSEALAVGRRVSCVEIARSYAVSHSTISRLAP